MGLPENPYADSTYVNLDFSKNEIEHNYGKNVHILSDAVALSQLADLCQANTTQPQINHLIFELYHFLIRRVVNNEFPKESISIQTRMYAHSDRGIWSGRVVLKDTKVVTVNVMRAGALPSQISYDFLNTIVHPHQVRQDHVIVSRVLNEKSRVIGAQLSGSKIGGDIDNAFVLFPDPMGATGSSISEIISHYKKSVPGKPRKLLALHLIVTPEYLWRMKNEHPDVLIYALRLDRGASKPEALLCKPGEKWQEESGLTEDHYIIPGGGGFGELMNNSYC